MRLLLDAHVSSRRVGTALRARGHDVVAADEDTGLRGLDDDVLLGMAAVDGRIAITFDAKDFARIHRDWVHAGNHHAGCLVLTGIDHSRLGDILRAVDSALASRPGQDEWNDLLVFVCA